MKAKRDLSERDIIKLLLYCDSGSGLNLVSEKKAQKDGVKIKQGPHPYKARDVQGKSLEIIGYAEYFLLNEHNYVRRIECAVSKYGSSADIIINLETLKLMGVVDENFPRIKNSKFEEGAEKLHDVEEEDEEDEYNFSHICWRNCIHPVEDTEKEAILKEIEKKLVEEYTPQVFQDNLEGRTMHMDPVDIAIDKSIPECKYPKPALVSRNVPLNYLRPAYDLIQKQIKEGIITPVNEPTKFCARSTYVPKADGVSLRMVTDFRGLNKIIQRPVWPFSSTESIIAKTDPSKQWIASIDMLSGYHQIPLSEESSFLTCFIMPWGKFRYLRGPMGLAPTGDWFCFATDLVTNGIPGLEKSLDDVLAACESAEKLENTLRTFLEKCKKHGVTLNRKKFKCSTMIKYGGHVLDTQGDELVVKPDPEKLEWLCAFPRPQGPKDVQSLIGILKTFERWNFSLSGKCEKIRELGKKDNKFFVD